MKNNAATKCFDFGSVRHLVFHKERPTKIDSMKKKTGILNGVRKQLTKDQNPSEILACLAVASDESLNIEREKILLDDLKFLKLDFPWIRIMSKNQNLKMTFSELPLKYLLAIERKIL